MPDLLYASDPGQAIPGELTKSMKYLFWAFALGCFSAASLLIGAVMGITWKPSSKMTASLAAFGAGAMLAALSVELVAPTMMNISGHSDSSSDHSSQISLILGAMAGGILFVLLDQIVNRHGGYLRKTATAITYMTNRRKEQERLMLELLSRSDFLMALDPEHVTILIRYLQPVFMHPGEIVFEQGDEGDNMYIVESGHIDILRDGHPLATLSSGDIVGEIALVTHAPRTAKVVARDEVKLWMLNAGDFDHMRSISRELDAEVRRITAERLEHLGRHDREVTHRATQWAQAAAKALQEEGALIPSVEDLRKAAKEHVETPLAIWLGMVLDGIPESLVIGTTFLSLLMQKSALGPVSFTEVIPYTLMAGFFLSNFPEALSSSVGMRSQDWSIKRILTLWFSLMVMTAVGSILGYLIGADINPVIVVAIEGVAAGAMLTMIAQTMIPEAVHLGGPTVVGLSTLTGFLAATSFKLLET
ncbi:MAG: cyclic nucleotide-binding domain-containing protein [FCB group bacterium]|nr:cyclic nucleotide-binding domain-containing protein [FCB group bacterium]